MTITLSEERNVTLTMYLCEESKEFTFGKRPLMIVLPGGGYGMCSDREAEVVAMQYIAAGYQAAVLRYTLKDKAGWPYPINDYDEAVELITEHADEWNIDMDHFAVVGFSAGGHLAACTATIAKHRPKAAILVYPAILQDIVDACQPGMPYPAECVDHRTSPCFIVAARDDIAVNCRSSLVMAEALEKEGINFELRIYSHGNHGFSTGQAYLNAAPRTARLTQWVPDSISWLEDIMGALTPKGFAEPVLGARLNGNDEPVLNVRCTLGLLSSNAAAAPMLASLNEGIAAAAKGMGVSPEALIASFANVSVKSILEMLSVPTDAIEQMDAALRQIPNV